MLQKLKKLFTSDNKAWLKTIQAGDILILNSGDRVIVKWVYGQVVEVSPLVISDDEIELAIEYGFPGDEPVPFMNHYSLVTGGVIEFYTGMDGNKPNQDHPQREMWSELISKA